jgi:glucosamine-6-phosphate deaminase
LEFRAGNARVAVHDSAHSAGTAAGEGAARIIRDAVAKKGRARVIAATGNSQIPFVEALINENINWKAVELFHMDEYAGIQPDHPSSFRHWIRTRLEEKVHPRVTHYLNGDAADLQAEMMRYTELLKQAPIDVAFVGFGENGHIAFNDPAVADFNDPVMVKIVTLDEACRRQQAGEGHFSDVAAVPREAVTITCSGLFRADAWICCVPEGRKAQAVRNALEGAISEACPASLVRRHPNAGVYLDTDSGAFVIHGRSGPSGVSG